MIRRKRCKICNKLPDIEAGLIEDKSDKNNHINIFYLKCDCNGVSFACDRKDNLNDNLEIKILLNRWNLNNK